MICLMGHSVKGFLIIFRPPRIQGFRAYGGETWTPKPIFSLLLAPAVFRRNEGLVLNSVFKIARSKAVHTNTEILASDTINRKKVPQ